MAAQVLLQRVRDATRGGHPAIFLDVGATVTTRLDLELLHALLRLMRLAPSLIVARVGITVNHLSLFDLVLCLCADRVIADEGALSDDMRPIEWSEEQPAFEAFVDAMWSGALGNARAQALGRPCNLADLRDAGVLSSMSLVQQILYTPRCLQPEYLVGLRRMGALRVKQMDKMSFNFYWVTKVMRLNALLPNAEETGGEHVPSRRPVGAPRGASAAPSAPHLAIRAWLDRGGDETPSMKPSQRPLHRGCAAGTLHVTILASVLEMNASDIHAALLPWSRDPAVARVLITLPAAAQGTAATQRIVPAEVVNGRTTLYKWYRKFDLAVEALAATKPLACVLLGPTCPCLLELFFASHARAWRWVDSATSAASAASATAAATAAASARASPAAGWLPSSSVGVVSAACELAGDVCDRLHGRRPPTLNVEVTPSALEPPAEMWYYPESVVEEIQSEGLNSSPKKRPEAASVAAAIVAAASDSADRDRCGSTTLPPVAARLGPGSGAAWPYNEHATSPRTGASWAGAGPAAAVPLPLGAAVDYTPSSGYKQPARVTAVHPGGADNPEPYYTIAIESGGERSTEGSRLALRQTLSSRAAPSADALSDVVPAYDPTFGWTTHHRLSSALTDDLSRVARSDSLRSPESLSERAPVVRGLSKGSGLNPERPVSEIGSPGTGKVGFYGTGHMPGPAAMRHISHAGRVTLRTLLLDGVPLEEAVRLGLVSTLSLVASGPWSSRHPSGDPLGHGCSSTYAPVVDPLRASPAAALPSELSPHSSLLHAADASRLAAQASGHLSSLAAGPYMRPEGAGMHASPTLETGNLRLEGLELGKRPPPPPGLPRGGLSWLDTSSPLSGVHTARLHTPGSIVHVDVEASMTSLEEEASPEAPPALRESSISHDLSRSPTISHDHPAARESKCQM